MPLPTLSPEQRAAALEKAAEIRKARAELKEQLKSGKTTLTKVLDRAETDEVVGKLQGVGAAAGACRASARSGRLQIMDKLKIAESRRLRGLGDQQRRALLAEFAANGWALHAPAMLRGRRRPPARVAGFGLVTVSWQPAGAARRVRFRSANALLRNTSDTHGPAPATSWRRSARLAAARHGRKA